MAASRSTVGPSGLTLFFNKDGQQVLSVAGMFKTFLDNLKITNKDSISHRYGEITSVLNKKFREIDSKTANCLQVGSYGRRTAVNGVSDLDMLYIMPSSAWDTYKNGGQKKLLGDVRDAIKDRYSRTEIWGDGQVLVVSFGDQEVEIVPSFEQSDGSFAYPDTNNGGRWPTTKPRDEISAMRELNEAKNKNLKRLCKMTRAWRNKHGVNMGGLLIDTLAFNFLSSTDEYDAASFLYYPYLVRDFFKYLAELEKQSYYLAPGSRQHVKVKKPFQRKARKAYQLCLKAIECEEPAAQSKSWKKVFGRPFPKAIVNDEKALTASAKVQQWDDTEEFIEDRYPVDVRYHLAIDCVVTQNGFRPSKLSTMLAEGMPLKIDKNLMFQVVEMDVPKPHEIFWKVLNRGEEAQRRNLIRGQLLKDKGFQRREETTNFNGEHIVECFAVRKGVVVARDEIDVPIRGGKYE